MLIDFINPHMDTILKQNNLKAEATINLKRQEVTIEE